MFVLTELNFKLISTLRLGLFCLKKKFHIKRVCLKQVSLYMHWIIETIWNRFSSKYSTHAIKKPTNCHSRSGGILFRGHYKSRDCHVIHLEVSVSFLAGFVVKVVGGAKPLSSWIFMKLSRAMNSSHHFGSAGFQFFVVLAIVFLGFTFLSGESFR